MTREHYLYITTQFIAICNSPILAETLSYTGSILSPWCGKRRILERRKLLLIEQLQPSTNSDKLSDRILRQSEFAAR